MKVTHVSKVLSASVIAASLAILPLSLPASAQTDTQPNTTTEDTTRPTIDTTPFQETSDGNNNWGWLGLLGLIGLANLFRKPKQTVQYTETDATTRSSRY